MVATQKIQVGMTHAGKIITVISENDHFRLVIDGNHPRRSPRYQQGSAPLQGLRRAPALG